MTSQSEFQATLNRRPIKSNVIVTVTLAALMALPLMVFGAPDWRSDETCYMLCEATK